MLIGLNVTRRPGVAPLGASLLVHGLLLAGLLWAHSPKFLAPNGLQAGTYGTSVTTLYWPPSSAAPLSDVSRAHHQQRPPHLIFNPSRKARAAPDQVEISSMEASSSGAEAQRLGFPYGSVLNGALSGHDIRPALPTTTSDPVVTAADLSGGVEGDIVVEITIDDQGNIVGKTLIRSLAPTLDLKVLAALEKWHFRPASRDGAPMSSKQDVYYHFPQRR